MAHIRFEPEIESTQFSLSTFLTTHRMSRTLKWARLLRNLNPRDYNVNVASFGLFTFFLSTHPPPQLRRSIEHRRIGHTSLSINRRKVHHCDWYNGRTRNSVGDGKCERVVNFALCKSWTHIHSIIWAWKCLQSHTQKSIEHEHIGEFLFVGFIERSHRNSIRRIQRAEDSVFSWS